MNSCRAMIVSLICIWTIAAGPARCRTLRPFTIDEEIGLANFNHWGTTEGAILVSPNGKFVAIRAEQGLLDENRVEDELRVYRVAALSMFVRRGAQRPTPAPILDLREATYKWGPIISHVRWLPDSTGLAFLLTESNGKHRLMLIGIKQTSPEALSLPGQDVTGSFDVRNGGQYVYSVVSWGRELRPLWEGGRIAQDVTGWQLPNVLIAQEVRTRWRHGMAGGQEVRGALWEARGGRPHPVLNEEREPIVVYSTIGLSPDARTLVTALPVSSVPERWVREFPPQSRNSPLRLHAGSQNVDVTGGDLLTKEYVLINLASGTVTPVSGTPTGVSNGWLQTPVIAWSENGKAVLLSNEYLEPADTGHPVIRPCVAVYYPTTHAIKCLKSLKSQTEPGFFLIDSMGFVGTGSDRVIMRYDRYAYRDGAETTRKLIEVFQGSSTGLWHVAGSTEPAQAQRNSLAVSIKQSFNESPVVVAGEAGMRDSHVVWDPNPQLKDIDLGKASVYHWTSSTGREWLGGLYWPANYVAGRRYPLVIQTHGFAPGEFRPSGLFPTAFAARALAARGMFVLQVPLCLPLFTPRAAACDAATYTAAVRKLASQALIDPRRVGIIGFSYTVYSVLEGLTTQPLRFAAASITSGWNFGYWHYLALVDSQEDGYAQEADSLIGAKPFGAGLRLWLDRAPDFNLQKVHTPLLITSAGRLGLLGAMWEPYALLRYLDKPVDLVLLDTQEHVLTEPAARVASQGGSVDWFRFWLQGYESPHPVMPNEYRRWEALCDMQRAQTAGRGSFCVPTRHSRVLQGPVSIAGSRNPSESRIMLYDSRIN